MSVGWSQILGVMDGILAGRHCRLLHTGFSQPRAPSNHAFGGQGRWGEDGKLIVDMSQF